MTAAGRELTITRAFDAPRELVFRAWTDPEHLALWWGPAGATTMSAESEPRVGGRWRIRIGHPELDADQWAGGVYLELRAPERLVFTFAWERPPGTRVDESVITIGLADQDGKTVMTFHQAAFGTAEERDAHADGWSGGFDNLAAHLATMGT
ncbi:SRPBCC family protein [Pseudonocardia acaciae]|uniref:SRPBCC family protein n=1 Tax=Pseudonocardia acaciae TaxID=551276 RepID=UPI00048DD2E4|nr:SRPBCC domain-containing protein [Pseudonocardia acaciae]